MSWVAFALLTAFCLSTADALSKRVLRDTDAITVAWVREGYALPFLLVAFLFIDIPQLDSTFWLSVGALLPLEIFALVLYMSAIKLSPLSLSVPFMALSPAFIVFVASALLGEWPSNAGFAGIGMIIIGAYLLNASSAKEGVLGPLRAIARERGSVLMIVVAIIYSVTATLGKVAVEHSGPIFFGFFYPVLLTAAMSAILISKGKLKEVVSRPRAFLGIGLFTSTMIISHFIAISLTQVAYMVSVKRTSLVLSVVYGWLLFKEERIKERLLGSAVMLGGAIVIMVWG